MLDLLIQTDLGAKLIYILGIINVISIILIFISCRCLAGANLVHRMMNYAWYRKFHLWHCHYWWIFFVSVILHTLLVFYLFGNPF